MNAQTEAKNINDELIQNLRERPDTIINENFERNKKALYEFYESIGGDRDLLNRVKYNEFRKFFGRNLFDAVVHKGGDKVVNSERHFQLKSPTQLGYSSSSGKLDEQMGNTDFVFASFHKLRSNSSRYEENNFLIKSEECYVVPADIDHVHIQDHAHDDSKRLTAYLNNIYKYEQFKEIFALICAMIFDSPQEAIAFFQYFNMRNYPDQAAAWEDDNIKYQDHEYLIYNGFDNDSQKWENYDATGQLHKLKKLYFEYGIIPPFSPELQFRKEVKGVRIS